jgi:tripartite-type tricarboxylate transporter receptor subunit TctC
MRTSVVDRLGAAIAKALAHPDIANRLRQEGAEAVGSSSAELKSHLARELVRWKDVVKAAGISVN